MAEAGAARRGGRLRWPWRLLHAVIIANFVAEIVYAQWVIFVALAPPDGSVGPLWGQAASVSHELLVSRRLYALEAWLAIGGLAIYLALTEIGPRLRAARAADP